MTNIFRRAGVDIPEPFRRFLEGDMDAWLRVEEYREAGSLVVKAEAAGIDPDNDVDITLAGSQLQITVRREEKTEHREKEGYRSEFRYGSFSRTVNLPAAVNQDDIRASYNDGVLEVRIPLPEEPAAGGRKVRVSRGAEAGGAETRGTGTGAAGTGGPSRTMGEDSEGQSFGGP
ncbi:MULTISPECIES: Hsp20/alpha crystallin family protein [Arthrobacter]|uniref:Hsp20/alpha crystallin family protein n=1 Tax=Arthrobacter TaxID=1663 RepID=UPI000971AAB5|nr:MULTISPECIES: Hsp20/alpha crystallin family protein [Arthrobacter]APX02629.1 heat-shock protein Hsp20 [Arthrobacter sp. QXT-31]